MSISPDSGGDSQLKYKINILVPFPSTRLAEVAYDVLRVDTEPKRSGVLKELSLKGNILQVKLSANIAKQLRVATNGIFANLILINQTIDCVGPPVSDSYSHFS